MGYWNHRDLVLGDAPADCWTAAWRRVNATHQQAPTLHAGLVALAEALRQNDIWPRAGAVVARVDGAPTVSEGPVRSSPLEAEWSRAIREIDALYIRDIGRPVTGHEVVATFDFVVRPDPTSFFSDGSMLSSGRWSFALEPEAGAVRHDFSCVFVAVSATDVSRRLIEDAGGRVVDRAAHGSTAEAARWLARLTDLAPDVEVLTLCETEALGFTPPSTVLIRYGRLATTFGRDHVRRWSEALGTWCIALETVPRPRLVGALLGVSLGVDDVPPAQDGMALLNRLGDALGFTAADPTTGFGVHRVETWLLRMTPPRPPPDSLRSPTWLGAVAAEPSRTRAVLATLSPPGDWRLLDGSNADRAATFSLLRGTPDPATWAVLTSALDGWALGATFDGDGGGQLDAYDAGGGTRRSVVQGPSAFIAAFGDLTLMVGEGPGEIRWPPELRGESAADWRAPGLFEVLAGEGLVHAEDVAMLQRLLPPTWLYHPLGSERLDSTRWPCDRDARLAARAAQGLPDPDGVIAELLLSLPRAGRDIGELKRLVTVARAFADEALSDDDADPALAMAAQDLAEAHLAAARGLDAYHVHRRLPGLSATHSAAVVRFALERDLIDVDALIEAAITSVPGILDAPAWFWSLLDEARGVADLLRPALKGLTADRLAAFHAYHRDLATRLTGDPWRAQLPERCSDETVYEAAARVVTGGRAWFRAVASDPALMPREARPGAAARAILGLPSEIWDERFGPEPFPTDLPAP